MQFNWQSWTEKRNCAALHGVTPSIADGIAGQSDNPFEDAFLNVRPDPLDLRDFYYEPSLAAVPTCLLPLDIDELGLPIRDQGAEGSCTGQALAAVIDLQNWARRDENQSLAMPDQVSARMLYDMARYHDEFADDGLPGSSVRGALKGFFHNGVCDAALAPYFPGDLGWNLTVEMGKAARVTSLGAYFRLRHILNHYHAALGEVGALICSAMVHDGWLRDQVRAENGRIRMPGSAGEIEPAGAHAFAIVGYDQDGFYVLNSWGRDWGGTEVEDEGEYRLLGRGIAHWSYEDWQAHVLDAWVLRLAAPFPRAFGMVGGYIRPRSELLEPGSLEAVVAPEPAVSRQRILGYYIHLDDGRLVTVGDYPSSIESVHETAEYLRRMDDEADSSKRYDRVVLYAHGGLNTLKNAAARLAAMKEGFKRNGVYPIFIFWRTGLFETLGDVITGIGQRILLRTAGVEDLTNRLIEEAAQRIGRPIWSDMKADTERAFTVEPGEGWDAVGAILAALAARNRHPASVHFIGHSAGAILLGRLFERMNGEAAPPVGSVSLMAPACTEPFFFDHLDPFAAANGGAARCTTFILPDAAERADRVAIYRRSLLYLISNGLEGCRRVPLAGMERYWPGSPEWTTVVAGAASPDSRSSTHSGFDNDPETMNTILSRICGRQLEEGNGGFTAAELNFR